MRHGGDHVFICGPGDPEDFLYVGERNADGTRNGDQLERINKLIEQWRLGCSHCEVISFAIGTRTLL